MVKARLDLCYARLYCQDFPHTHTLYNIDYVNYLKNKSLENIEQNKEK